jgi:uncharacterized protein YcfL
MKRIASWLAVFILIVGLTGCSSGQDSKVLKFKKGDVVVHKANKAKGIILNLHESKMTDTDYNVRFARASNAEGNLFDEVYVQEFEIEAPPAEKETTQ